MAEYIVYVLIYRSNSCICKNNTANLLKLGQQLFGLTLECYEIQPSYLMISR